MIIWDMRTYFLFFEIFIFTVFIGIFRFLFLYNTSILFYFKLPVTVFHLTMRYWIERTLYHSKLKAFYFFIFFSHSFKGGILPICWHLLDINLVILEITFAMRPIIGSFSNNYAGNKWILFQDLRGPRWQFFKFFVNFFYVTYERGLLIIDITMACDL